MLFREGCSILKLDSGRLDLLEILFGGEGSGRRKGRGRAVERRGREEVEGGVGWGWRGGVGVRGGLYLAETLIRDSCTFRKPYSESAVLPKA